MKRHLVSIILAAASLACGTARAQDAGGQKPEQDSGVQPLMLTCRGTGISVSVSTDTTRFSGANGRSVTGYTTSSDRASYEGQVEIQLFTGKDRIRLPIAMVPRLYRSDNGWYRITDSNANDRVINAITYVNMFNTPEIRIDRIAGTIEVSSRSGSFTGYCQKVDPEAQVPKF